MMTVPKQLTTHVTRQGNSGLPPGEVCGVWIRTSFLKLTANRGGHAAGPARLAEFSSRQCCIYIVSGHTDSRASVAYKHEAVAGTVPMLSPVIAQAIGGPHRGCSRYGEADASSVQRPSAVGPKNRRGRIICNSLRDVNVMKAKDMNGHSPAP